MGQTISSPVRLLIRTYLVGLPRRRCDTTTALKPCELSTVVMSKYRKILVSVFQPYQVFVYKAELLHDSSAIWNTGLVTNTRLN